MDTHTKAVEAAIAAAGRRLTAVDEPLIELARSLALQMDATGADGPGTRLSGTYLTTVRTLMARLGSPAATGTGKLAELRKIRDRQAPTKKRSSRVFPTSQADIG